MKRLFLLRHAKAGFGQDDKTRPLASRGGKDALWLGQYLAKRKHRALFFLPDYALCSSATRARGTLEKLSEGAKTSFPTTYHDDLYLASADHMTKHIRKLPPSINAAMIIAHNPGICTLLQKLAHAPITDVRSLKYPTCMLSIIDFDIAAWSDLKDHTGQISRIIIPSDIIAAKKRESKEG